jgi:hypothetical protein
MFVTTRNEDDADAPYFSLILPASTNHHRLEMPNQRHWNWNRYPAKVKSQPTRVRRPPFSNNENTKEWNGNLGGQNRGQSRDIWTTRSCLGLWRSLSFISFHHQYGRLSFASFWTIRVCCRFATAWKEHMIIYGPNRNGKVCRWILSLCLCDAFRDELSKTIVSQQEDVKRAEIEVGSDRGFIPVARLLHF